MVELMMSNKASPGSDRRTVKREAEDVPRGGFLTKRSKYSVMGHHGVFPVILLCYHLLFVGIIQCTRSPSKENDLGRHIHLKLLSKPSTKTIKAISTQLPYINSGRDSSTITESSDQYLTSEMCQTGTIPTRRTSKMDIEVGENSIVKRTDIANRPNTYLAVVRTKVGPQKYSGAEGDIKVDNPKVVGQQYSAARIRLEAGKDSIEVGWRVDPTLYGDSRTRWFLRTDTGRTHCFDARCPGFIHTNHEVTLGDDFGEISIPGGPVFTMPFSIIRDNRNGNWNLTWGKHDPVMIGFWPSRIFTGLRGLASRVEWGGEAYSPPGTSLPPMGSGNHPVGHTKWDGFIYQMKVLNEKGQKIDASNLETFEDNPKLYSVRDDGSRFEGSGHIMYYGGSGRPNV